MQSEFGEFEKMGVEMLIRKRISEIQESMVVFKEQMPNLMSPNLCCGCDKHLKLKITL